jgi:SNF2 family DNA or RNA helicase
LAGIDRRRDSKLFLMRYVGSSSLAEGNVLALPGGVQIEEYQLVPVTRAVAMPRVSLLIADDVGLGKTIEAGLIAQELIHSHRATRILVLCPAHLKGKWVEEMRDKFGLEFRIIDRDSVQQMRREFGPTINPWASFPRLVTSIDYLKTEHPRRLFEELLDKGQRDKGLKPWDLLILDEAHNAAPAGRKQYVRDSDRTTLLRALAGHFEHKIFLTATPHNGYRKLHWPSRASDDLRFHGR